MDTVVELVRSELSKQADKRGFVLALQLHAGVSPITSIVTFPATTEDVLRAARDWLAQREFSGGGREIDHASSRLEMAYEREFGRNDPLFAEVPGLTTDQLRIRIEVRVSPRGQDRIELWTSKPVRALLVNLERHLKARFAMSSVRDRQLLENPVCPPGVPVSRAWTGALRDYSGCASLAEIDDLIHRPGDGKALPLGFYRFLPENAGAKNGYVAKPEHRSTELLSLGVYHSKARMEFNGMLVVAPQNSGKTELIVRWALAANRAGYNVLVVDVKGNLMPRLGKAGLKGRVWHYSTDPEPEDEVHALNLLADVSCTSRVGRHRLKQLIDSVIRVDEHDGKNQDWWATQKTTLEGIILLLKLRDHAFPGKCADFGEVYDLAMSEDALIELVTALWERLPEGRSRAEQPRKIIKDGALRSSAHDDGLSDEPAMDRFFLRFVFQHLRGIVSEGAQGLPDGLPGGQREPRYTYHTMTLGITMALGAFNSYGTLAPHSGGQGDFSLSDIDSAEQTMIVLAAREHDGDIARTVLTMAIKRIEQILYDRRKVAEPARPILLLLDETRRIRGFDPADFITFARDAKAGCVLVYQSLMQIEDERHRQTILENIGTQIYLRSLSGKTAEAFIDLLPRRARRTFSFTETSGDGQSTSVQTGNEDVPLIEARELYRLPAGPNPALVFIKDHRSGKPFLVDMSREDIQAALDCIHKEAGR